MLETTEATEAPTAWTDESVSEQLKVLIWSTAGAGLHYNGPGISVYRLYQQASPERFQFELAHGNPEQEDYELFRRHHLVAPFKMDTMSQIKFILKGRRWCRQHISSYDIFHGLSAFESTVEPALVAESRGVPAFLKMTLHKTILADKPTWRSRLGVTRRRREKVKRVSGLIAISRAIADELRGYGVPESRIAEIPDGVDITVFTPPDTPEDRSKLRASLGWPDRPTIVFVGTIVRRKQPHLLLEGLIAAHKKGLEVQLAMVGPETDEAYCKEMRDRAKAAGVEDFVTWVGFTREVAPLVRAGEMYGLVSQAEGLPNALIEAMAAGAACIGSKISGALQLIDHGRTGMLVDQTPEAVADAMISYLESPADAWANGQAARRLVEEEYSSVAVLEAHERMFRRVLAGGPAAE